MWPSSHRSPGDKHPAHSISMKIEVHITDQCLSLPQVLTPGCGAVVRFDGIVRGEEDGQVIDGLTYEAYGAMAEHVIGKILCELGEHHSLGLVRVHHRVGFVPVGKAAICMDVHTRHREPALALVREFMDRLKQDVPIWKVPSGPAPCRPSPSTPEQQGDATIAEVLALIDQKVHPLPSEDVSVSDAVGRVTGSHVVSPTDLPSFSQSAMDGYAFAETHPERSEILGTIAAGDPAAPSPAHGKAVRILTGGAVPEGTVCIARQEDCLVEEGFVSLRSGIQLHPGLNIRLQGGIRAQGECLLSAGSVVTPGALALLISAGVQTVHAIRSPRITHLATGSELLSENQVPTACRIPDSNGPMMQALLEKQGIPLVRFRIADDFSALADHVAQFEGDLLLISGGSGPGDHDHTRHALEASGFTLHVSRVNSRPGRPLLFATRGAQAAFGLPGNPLSHFVCHHVFVRQALARLSGYPPPKLISARWLGPSPKMQGDPRPTWTPGILSHDQAGPVVEPLTWLHSGDLTPLAHASALIHGTPDAHGRVSVLTILS